MFEGPVRVEYLRLIKVFLQSGRHLGLSHYHCSLEQPQYSHIYIKLNQRN